MNCFLAKYGKLFLGKERIKMPKYEVTMTWESWMRVEVEADSLAEARELGQELIAEKGEGQEYGGEWQDSAEAELVEEEEEDDE
jgi:hypothetical protein